MDDLVSTLSGSETENERAALNAQPCQCVSCGTCRGSGHVWLPTRDVWPEDEISRCDDCDGSGITEQCDRCTALYELDRMDARGW
jgi:DnaJ-class molecular chaperone